MSEKDLNNFEEERKDIISESAQITEKGFMSMPIWKLIILEIITFGLYTIIWFYQQWQIEFLHHDNKEKIILNKIYVALCAFFAPISCFSLFPSISNFYEKHLSLDLPKYTKESFIFFICMLLSNGLSNIKTEDISTLRDSLIGGTFFLICSWFAIISLQIDINEYNKKTNCKFEENNWTIKTSICAIICLVLMGFYIYLIYLGLLMGNEIE